MSFLRWKTFTSLSIFLFGSSQFLHFSSLRRVQSILRVRLPMYLFIWLDFCCRVWFQEVFLFFWGTLSYFFLLSWFVWWCQLLIYPDICDFPFLQMFWCFPDWAEPFLQMFLFFLFILSLAWHISQSKIQFLYLHWSCRIHQLHLCRGVKLPQQVSWIWH